jgi:hypothetical protein
VLCTGDVLRLRKVAGAGQGNLDRERSWKAATFYEVPRRNPLRKATGLPSLNFSAKYAYPVAVTPQRDFRAIYEGHTGEHAAERKISLRQAGRIPGAAWS